MNWLHLIASTLSVLIRFLRPGGVRALVAENIVLRQQLIVVQRPRKRAPTLSVFDRFLFGLLAAFIQPKRLAKLAIVLKPATIGER